MVEKKINNLNIANQKFKIGLLALLIIAGVGGLYYWGNQANPSLPISDGGTTVSDNTNEVNTVSVTDETHAANITAETGQSTAGSESTIDDILKEMAN